MDATQLPHCPLPRLPPHLAPARTKRQKGGKGDADARNPSATSLPPPSYLLRLRLLLALLQSAPARAVQCSAALARASDGHAGRPGVVPGARAGGAGAPVVLLGVAVVGADAGAGAAAGGHGRADHHAGRLQAGLHLPRLRVSLLLLIWPVSE